jgi:CBS domain-containing protein
MTNLITFYLSQIIGQKIQDENGNYSGRLSDLQVDVFLQPNEHPDPEKPKVTGIKLKYHKKSRFVSFESFRIEKIKDKVCLKCIKKPVDISPFSDAGGLLLCHHVLDKQIVDLDGIKVVRVNDIRLAMVSYGLYVVAVDIGVSGLLRRIGIEKPIQDILSVFNARIPAEYISWDDLATIDDATHNITLSKTTDKLNKLHPSDLADILEELGKASITKIFSSLDNEKAADVLEELETSSQIHLIESLSVEKAADVLEKMPANEAADIIDELEDEKQELLLNEMEKESSEDVKEILEYPDNCVGSIMTTDFLAFTENKTVEDVLVELRIKKPESDLLYNLFITDENSRLKATLSLRDLVISEPHKMLKEIMTLDPLSVLDHDKLDSLAEITEKYNLLAIPVIDEEEVIQGMVVIDDIIEDLLKKGRTNK